MFVQLFRYTGVPINSLLVDAVEQGQESLRKARFAATWSARVSKDGRFRSMAVKDIEFSGESFTPPTSDDNDRYGLQASTDASA